MHACFQKWRQRQTVLVNADRCFPGFHLTWHSLQLKSKEDIDKKEMLILRKERNICKKKDEDGTVKR
ncbi:hypothetical protein LSAT2_030799 [Lamellibrachia satsuma]|nr:hypothetical protein LSAT2_030799 [Lamellibrachia satsuma]